MKQLFFSFQGQGTWICWGKMLSKIKETLVTLVGAGKLSIFHSQGSPLPEGWGPRPYKGKTKQEKKLIGSLRSFAMAKLCLRMPMNTFFAALVLWGFKVLWKLPTGLLRGRHTVNRVNQGFETSEVLWFCKDVLWFCLQVASSRTSQERQDQDGIYSKTSLPALPSPASPAPWPHC